MMLKTQRLGIRFIVEADWKDVQSIWEDFKRSRYAQYDHPFDTDADAVRARMARWERMNQGREHMFFAVCLEERVIGYVAFNQREEGYEIGYCFHSDAHGKGHARESLLALFDYMRNLGIKRLIAGTALQNMPSVRMLCALGFRKIGEEKVSFYKNSQGNDIFFEGGIFEKIL